MTLVLESKWRGIASEQRSQFLVENFYNLLTRRDAAENSFPERFFFDPRDESSCNLKVYIRFNERQTHLAQCSVDVGFANNAVPTQVLENILKLVAELRKHDGTGVAL